MTPRAGPLSWIAAIMLAVLFHVALALPLTISQSEGMAEAPGAGGIEIALGPKGGAPGGQSAAETDPPPEESAAEAEEPSRPVEPEAPESDVLPDETLAPVPEPEFLPVEPAAASAPSVFTSAEGDLPPKRLQRESRMTAPPGAGGKSGPEDSDVAGDRGSDLTAGGIAGAEADYAAILLAWLQHHKRYPRRAEARRQEGVVRLFIAVGRSGQVLEGRIDQGSGHRLLDQAALDMLERAAPLPPIPEDVPGERLEIVVPTHFFFTRLNLSLSAVAQIGCRQVYSQSRA